MSKTKKYKTSFLYKKHNTIVGAGSIFNIAGNYFEYNYSKSGFEADKKAIENDWGVVGNDMKDAIKAIAKTVTISQS